MLQGRSLCKISLLIVIMIALSAYGPYDFLGLYSASGAVDMFLTDGDSVCSTGQIYRKEIKNNQTQYFIKDAQVITDRGTLSDISYTFNFDSDSFPIKSKIKLSGTVSKFMEPRNQGEFNIKDYYNSNGVYFQINEVEVIDVNEPDHFDYDCFYRLNKSVVSLYSRILAAREAGILSSIVAGNKSELDENIRVARVLLNCFDDMKIRINEHLLVFGHKNPEYTINEKLGDRKGVESENGIKSAFRKAKEQGCMTVVLDFDMHMSDSALKTKKIASGIYGRHEDFISGNINECYVVHNSNAIVVKSDVFAASDKDAVKKLIENEIEKIEDITYVMSSYGGQKGPA